MKVKKVPNSLENKTAIASAKNNFEQERNIRESTNLEFDKQISSDGRNFLNLKTNPSSLTHLINLAYEINKMLLEL